MGTTDRKPTVIGIVGGTGKEGSALALRWSAVGHRVLIGLRDPARAEEKARELAGQARGEVRGVTNEAAAREGEVVVLSVPYSAHGATLRELAPALEGKLLLDVTVPIDPKAPTAVRLPPGGAAALEGQAILGDRTRIVAGLHHVSFLHLKAGATADAGDVLLCGDDPAAVEQVIGLVADLGLRGVNAGPLRNAVALEALTPVLLHINRSHRAHVGVRLTGLPEPSRG